MFGPIDYLQSPAPEENLRRIKAQRSEKRRQRLKPERRTATPNENLNPEPGTRNNEPGT